METERTDEFREREWPYVRVQFVEGRQPVDAALRPTPTDNEDG